MKRLHGSSPAVQWLGLGAFTPEGPGSIPGQEIKIPQDTRHSRPPPPKKIERLQKASVLKLHFKKTIVQLLRLSDDSVTLLTQSRLCGLNSDTPD